MPREDRPLLRPSPCWKRQREIGTLVRKDHKLWFITIRLIVSMGLFRALWKFREGSLSALLLPCTWPRRGGGAARGSPPPPSLCPDCRRSRWSSTHSTRHCKERECRPQESLYRTKLTIKKTNESVYSLVHRVQFHLKMKSHGGVWSSVGGCCHLAGLLETRKQTCWI